MTNVWEKSKCLMTKFLAMTAYLICVGDAVKFRSWKSLNDTLPPRIFEGFVSNKNQIYLFGGQTAEPQANWFSQWGMISFLFAKLESDEHIL